MVDAEVNSSKKKKFTFINIIMFSSIALTLACILSFPDGKLIVNIHWQKPLFNVQKVSEEMKKIMLGLR